MHSISLTHASSSKEKTPHPYQTRRVKKENSLRRSYYTALRTYWYKCFLRILRVWILFKRKYATWNYVYRRQNAIIKAGNFNCASKIILRFPFTSKENSNVFPMFVTERKYHRRRADNAACVASNRKHGPSLLSKDRLAVRFWANLFYIIPSIAQDLLISKPRFLLWHSSLRVCDASSDHEWRREYSFARHEAFRTEEWNLECWCIKWRSKMKEKIGRNIATCYLVAYSTYCR